MVSKLLLRVAGCGLVSLTLAQPAQASGSLVGSSANPWALNISLGSVDNLCRPAFLAQAGIPVDGPNHPVYYSSQAAAIADISLAFQGVEATNVVPPNGYTKTTIYYYIIASCVSGSFYGEPEPLIFFVYIDSTVASLPPTNPSGPTPTIASVVFTGNPSNPSILINGLNFGTQPAATNLGYAGSTGYDYGQALHIQDFTAPAAFSAGYLNAAEGRDDYIGLVVSTYADTTISYQLGSNYSSFYYPEKIYALNDGDSFMVTVKGASYSGIVHYSGPDCTINTLTLAHVPQTIDTQRAKMGRIGVGEQVVLSLSNNDVATWAITSGNGSLTQSSSSTSCENATSSGSLIGAQVCFNAPYDNDNTTITATADQGLVCSVPLTTVKPTGLIFQRIVPPGLAEPGYRFFDFPPVFYDIGMMSAVFLTPGDVSFANINISEHDTLTPSPAPSYNQLFNVPVQTTGLNGSAWLVGCDADVDVNALRDVFSKSSYWVYQDKARPAGHVTSFSLVETQTSHTELTGDFNYIKGQISALSPSGSFVATPLAPHASLTVPRSSFPFANIPFLTAAGCPGAIKKLFPPIL